MKELHRQGKKYRTEHHNRVGTGTQKAIKAADRQNPFEFRLNETHS